MSLAELKLAVALPSYDGRGFNRQPLMHLARQVPMAKVIETRGSLLPLVFNTTLVEALKMHKNGEATHFLMLHDDIVPIGENWFRDFWTEYVRTNAQLICAVSPVKDTRGLTSIGRESEKKVVRYTTTEVMRGPDAFTHPGILLNTGCMLFALDEPWLRGCHFKLSDSIVTVCEKCGALLGGDGGQSCPKHGKMEGVLVPKSDGEDWNFTRMARANGCQRIYATKAVKLVHWGQQMYPNYQAWGMPKDDGGEFNP